MDAVLATLVVVALALAVVAGSRSMSVAVVAGVAVLAGSISGNSHRGRQW